MKGRGMQMKGLIGLIARPASNRRGATLAIVALGAPVLIGMIALGVDLGMMFSARAEAQRAADAGALAGAGVFQFQPDPYPLVAAAESQATAFATSNFLRDAQIVGAEVTAEANPDSQMVRVTVTRSVATWFARIFGVQTVTVGVEAVAQVLTADTPLDDCVLPFAVPDLYLNENASQDPNDNDIWDFVPNMNAENNAEHDPGELWTFDGGANGETYGDNDDPSPTGWGTTARDGIADAEGHVYKEDYGRRTPIKLSLPGNTEIPSFWYTWIPPGTESQGMDGIRQNIRSCGQATEVGSVDDTVEFDVETKNGLMGNPVWMEMKNVIEGDDPGAYWHEDCSGPYCTGEIRGSKYGSHEAAVEFSKRVFTIAFFHPADQDEGKEYMRFADFGRVFLEPMGSSFKNDITARFLGFVGGGGSGGEQVGTNIQYLRLIDEDRWVPYTAP
jgi:Flp pilus assembly protein TadG